MQIVPIEKLLAIVPKELDGHDGCYRSPLIQKAISADTDVEAVLVWLEKYRGNESTFRRYRNVANQLLNWVLVELHKPLSSLEEEDFQSYLIFLRNPTPRERWVSFNCRGSTESWRPFKGPLSAATLRNTLDCLRSLVNFLSHTGYCRIWNSLSRRQDYSLVTANLGRFVSVTPAWESRWAEVARYLVALGEPHDLPARLAMQLTFYGCLEISTLVTLTETAFKQHDGFMTLTVPDRLIYLVPPIVETLELMRHHRLLSPEFGVNGEEGRQLFQIKPHCIKSRVKKLLRCVAQTSGEHSVGVLPSLLDIKMWGKSHASTYFRAMWPLIGVSGERKSMMDRYLPKRRPLSAQEVESLFNFVGFQTVPIKSSVS